MMKLILEFFLEVLSLILLSPSTTGLLTCFTTTHSKFEIFYDY